MELKQFIQVYELSTGRRLYAVTRVQAVAARRDHAGIVALTQQAIMEDRETRELDLRWNAMRGQRRPATNIGPLDSRVDTTITALRDAAVVQTRGAAPDDPIHERVALFLAAVLPAGVYAVTSRPYVEQLSELEIILAIQTLQPGILLIALVSMAVLLAWESRAIKRLRWTTWIPGPLLAVVAGTLVNDLYGLLVPSMSLAPGSEHMVTLPQIGGLADVRSLLVFPDLAAFAWSSTWVLAFTLAAVASIETLLSIEATDKLDPCRRMSSPNRELIAQGVGNMLAGAIGGLPMTAVIVRSSANVYAGARTRMSAVVHGAFLAVSILLIPGILNRIPLASLASVLILIGYKLARVSLFKQLHRAGMDQFLPFIITVVAVNFSDLLTGVLIGLAAGLLVILRANFRSAIRVVRQDDDILIKFSKDVSFINKIKLVQVLRSVPDGASVFIDGTAALYIDSDIREMIRDFEQSASQRNIVVETKNIPTPKETRHE